MTKIFSSMQSVCDSTKSTQSFAEKRPFKEIISEKKRLNVTHVIMKSTTRKVLNDTKGF